MLVLVHHVVSSSMSPSHAGDERAEVTAANCGAG